MAVVFSAAATLLSFFLLLFLLLPDELYHSYYTDSPTQKKLIEENQKTPSAMRTALENPHGRMMRVLAEGGGGGGGLNLQENKERKRRDSTGPGSSPPTCANRCSMCKPCMLVKVPVKPGLPIDEIPAEYYPEAWRCKCNGKIYMP